MIDVLKQAQHRILCGDAQRPLLTGAEYKSPSPRGKPPSDMCHLEDPHAIMYAIMHAPPLPIHSLEKRRVPCDK